MVIPDIPIHTRLRLYKLTYKHLIQFHKQGWESGLCHRFVVIARDLGYDYPRPGMLIDKLPELMEYKPADLSAYVFSFWWPINDRDSRIKVLKRVIKKTMIKIKYEKKN